MKHLERLASLAFVTILISLVFHFLGMSFNRWKEVRLKNDGQFSHWFTSIQSRCYQSTIVWPGASRETFNTEFCIDNQWLTAKDPAFASECLQSALDDPQIVCAAKNYSREHCRCDSRGRTKAVLALTILVSLSLGGMLFISHALSLIHSDRILRWLVPVCFSLLVFSIVGLLLILFVAGTGLHEDVNGLEVLWSPSLFNETDQLVWGDEVKNITDVPAEVKLGWCFGMEILSLQFALVSLILYALMFIVKQRPED